MAPETEGISRRRGEGDGSMAGSTPARFQPPLRRGEAPYTARWNMVRVGESVRRRIAHPSLSRARPIPPTRGGSIGRGKRSYTIPSNAVFHIKIRARECI